MEMSLERLTYQAESEKTVKTLLLRLSSILPGDWAVDNKEKEFVFSYKEDDGLYIITKINKVLLEKSSLMKSYSRDPLMLICEEVVRQVKDYQKTLQYQKVKVMKSLQGIR